MAPPDVMQPGSTHLPETPRLLPLPPVGPPGPTPLSSQPAASPVTFSVAHPPGGPGAPRSSALPSSGILATRPGQSSFHSFFLGVIATSLTLPATFLGVFFSSQ